MTVPPAAALDPVVLRLRRDAEDQAAAIRAAARATAQDVLNQAHRDAAAITALAAATAAANAAPLTSAELRQARDGARSAVLSAQREACDELLSRVRAAIAELPAQQGYDVLREQIGRLAEQAAGPGASLSQEPGGGVEAHAPGVMVDCSLRRLADLAVAQLGAAITELWTP
jgi:vacuolar-type H+-ATPase subunit E/Vma4